MTAENKKRVRDEIAKRDDWVIIDGYLGEDVDYLSMGEKCEIIYVDMDNQPQMCHAMCSEYHAFQQPYFTAIDGPAKGNRMCAVVAYRRIKDEK